jgi:hypothetical protein
MNDEPKPKPITYTPEFRQEATIEVSCSSVVRIQKMFGPLIFADIRVRADFQSCEWIVERLSIKDGETWAEVARIPGQMDGEFEDED